ncbi:hypothetical protein [Luteolibacter sp.]|uniref:hypothetical protein n=1 Tax=Luteolibacter sp. TaxID=1962973 RepID=UPI0032640EFE
MLILLVAACLVWVGLLSLAYVLLSGTTISSGWIVAGALVFAVIAWVLVMIREIRDSILVPDFSAHGERVDENYDVDGKSTESRPNEGIAGRSLMGRRGMTPGRGSKSKPRKVRSRGAVLSESASR